MSKDPYRYFRIEARELVDTLQKGVVEAGTDPAKLRSLMRASHTLKGAAGVVRHAEIAKLAHEIEDLLVANAPADAILPLVDAVGSALAALAGPVAPVGGVIPNAPAQESVRLDLAEVDALLASLADLGARVGAIRSKKGAELEALLDGVERLARDTLEDARRLRLLPADTLFSEVARAAHDAASREGRLIEVETSGGDRRIDAHVLALVRDALLQLVRNAIAHGIEAPIERARAGKPKAGKIAVSVDVRGSRAIVTCRDDGGGIDVDAMRAAVVARGLVPVEEAAKLDATGLLKIAMGAGVSTRSAASELAGRGVGLQVVGETIHRLRGTLTVRTTRGTGTEIALDVPVSITAAPALVVEAAGQVVTIGLDAILRTTRIAATDVTRTAEGDAISDGGEAFPFGALASVLGSMPERESARDASTAVLLQTLEGRAAVGVDRILGIANTVVLPLPASAASSPIVAGASLDGDGNPQLALEPRRLIDAIRETSRRTRPLVATSEKKLRRARARVLVCDDSLTSRMLEQSILEAAGYDVVTATSGEDALIKAREQSFALYVVDVEMPGISGYETVARMRADPTLSSIPAVLVTSRAAPEDRRKGLEAGARAYIVKGAFVQTEFLDTIRRLIG